VKKEREEVQYRRKKKAELISRQRKLRSNRDGQNKGLPKKTQRKKKNRHSGETAVKPSKNPSKNQLGVGGGTDLLRGGKPGRMRMGKDSNGPRRSSPGSKAKRGKAFAYVRGKNSPGEA